MMNVIIKQMRDKMLQVILTASRACEFDYKIIEDKIIINFRQKYFYNTCKKLLQ